MFQSDPGGDRSVARTEQIQEIMFLYPLPQGNWKTLGVYESLHSCKYVYSIDGVRNIRAVYSKDKIPSKG